METLRIEKTENTPKIIFDPEQNEFLLEGNSIPEDVVGFYAPVLNWLDGLAVNPCEKMDLVVKLEYFNTSSSKIIMNILIRIAELKDKGVKASVKWYYEEEDGLEAGQAYSEIVGMEFEFLEF